MSDHNTPARPALGKVKPDPQDYEAIEREYGRLPSNASTAECAHRYQLAQCAKLLRLYEQGKLPLALMRELDKLAKRQRQR
jgi:hypothetical protein